MKIKDIKTSINKAIYDNIPSYTINSNDVREGYKDGSFYVTFTRSKKIMHNKYMYKRELEVRIYYFPKHKESYSIECYEMQERLENVFGSLLEIGNRVITIGDTDSGITDGVLYFDFELEFFVTYENSLENDGVLMDTLKLKTII